ncbi:MULTISPECIES: tRNA uridine-5-carboxymethylaminomethyl(34) synthesis GTPase MnmE [unclassified Undibacterium]|uniref:tRNA uridine-5-carboxymethylaminomethyl(34) synthesis GTPase MnmE n=1 Tax=unclassified Undibacterium TaxID=2630295 RepID=UPI002AC8E120|nr:MULTISPECIES: tRNA uridine-5-carboxymethylaminomethyl(34) synthesis GTPase MnmE [unclassified Undibacterium]MEB0140561.1 tRNA uridine-5-carboxymethylaminomethyl(34) synthesis GTPase MnmE [Undibacterium sp. CCC2.1]MEB0173619.1 tRNA uridine-5-carboxymethylaminomethyl(34) synthesis GTPase MnmE [Undibacterium sp. CCC1.1]MEB0177570.1 tRNA uridine-5-carboxymethylaminomethyl(34) synthesis GTPase MnmE [Undibacterium sp. CCC3.4]MEB0216738.1 tRNA uridine-5-carboxymethylaminomethyl(34) synthesis GTPase
MIHDTLPIVAIATAPGRGGIGVVRISGKQLGPLLTTLFGAQTLKPRHASYLPFTQADGSIIDQGLALFFAGPHSYTGEDVLELQGHGGPVVMQMLLTRCLEAGQAIGLRLAAPGEFTERAFLNDKLDLAQAEAVADLIEASTEAAAKSASQSLSGAFSKVINTLVEQVVHLRMLVEATLDFPEEEIDFLEKSNARAQLSQIQLALQKVFEQAAQGALLRAGLNVVLAGQPNVGKSSLLNALAGDDIAIVTPIAGTTRDKVTETIHIEGIPLNIIDTAGIRHDDDDDFEQQGGIVNHIDTVERIGIERTWAEVDKADVILHLLDAGRGPTRADEAIVARFPEGVPVIRIWNKIDLSGHHSAVDQMSDATHIYLSAQEHLGIDLLRAELLRIAGWEQTGESLYLARERHLIALKHAHEHLQSAAEFAAQNDQSLDLFAEELRLTQDRLNSITGEFSSDDLLGVIFSRFCIGK